MYPIYVVDEDRSSRVSTSEILRACGFETRPFISGSDVLDAFAELRPGVVLLKIRGDDAGTARVLHDFHARQFPWPVIVLADGTSVAQAVAAMKLGVRDVVEKPVQVEALLAILESVFAELELALVATESRNRCRKSFSALSPREQEVLQRLLAGQTNGQIAQALRVSLRTVEMHRAGFLKKLGVENLISAFHLALEADLAPSCSDIAAGSPPAGSTGRAMKAR